MASEEYGERQCEHNEMIKFVVVDTSRTQLHARPFFFLEILKFALAESVCVQQVDFDLSVCLFRFLSVSVWIYIFDLMYKIVESIDKSNLQFDSNKKRTTTKYTDTRVHDLSTTER